MEFTACPHGKLARTGKRTAGNQFGVAKSLENIPRIPPCWTYTTVHQESRTRSCNFECGLAVDGVQYIG